jgi:HK97 family phage portal protein
MRPDLTSQRRNSDGNLEFTFNDRGKVEILPEEKVFHIKGFGIDRDFGLSPISYARHTIGAAMGADEATSTIFKNGMWQSGFLTTERVLTAEQREQVRTMLGRFQGTRESGALLLLEAGLDFKPISMPPDDAQMLETRGFSVEEVCRWFRVPPILVGHSPDGQTMWGSGIEQIMIAFLTLSLRPYLRRTKGAIQKRLLYPEQRRKMYADFNVDGLLQADSAGRAALYSSFAQNGIYTRNELREKENQPKKPGGDLLTVQSNMVPLDGLGGNQTDAQKALNLVRDWLRSGEVEGSGT